MKLTKTRRIAALSMARNDQFFVEKWIRYYGELLGYENLYLVLDGHDQAITKDMQKANVIRLPHVQMKRSAGDKNRARLISNLGRSLFHRYDRVIAHDIDECLVVDPLVNLSLADYLQKETNYASLSGLGLDVGQHLNEEPAIDAGRPFLEQRAYAHVSSRYTKAVVANRPLDWGSGFHRVKGRNFHLDPHLYLFHFGMVDYETTAGKTKKQDLVDSGWQGHLDRRLEIFDLILKSPVMEGDAFFARARRRQKWLRPVYAWNKPGKLKEKPIIRIPERFRSIV